MNSERRPNNAPQRGRRGSKQVNNHQPSNDKVSSSNTARAPLTQKENRSSWYRGNVPDSVAVPSIQSGGCTHNPPSKRIRTILVFGETGVGKSSVVNMLAGKEVCKSSNDAVGCTFDHTRYCIEVADHPFHVYDTTGLNECGSGTVPSLKAIALLFKLIRDLANSDGIDFLVFVTRPRITENTQRNYAMFFKTLCKERVPIVIVVTGLEFEPDMKVWWERNEGRFREHEMRFSGHACVTATKGKQLASGYSLQTEYDQSNKTLHELISSQCRDDKPWKQDAETWFALSLANLFTYFSLYIELSRTPREQEMKQALIDHAQLKPHEAKLIARRITSCLKGLKR